MMQSDDNVLRDDKRRQRKIKIFIQYILFQHLFHDSVTGSVTTSLLLSIL